MFGCGMSESSLPNSYNSSMGVACVACVESALPAVAPIASVFSSPCPSDTGSYQGPRGGGEEGQRWQDAGVWYLTVGDKETSELACFLRILITFG